MPERTIRSGSSLIQRVLDAAISFEVPIYTAFIPGWPQWVLRQKHLAVVHLVTYLFFLIPTLLFLGSTVGSLSLGLVFASHFSSLLSVQILSRSDTRSRVVCGVSMIAVAALFVWLPMYRLLDWFGWPVELQQPMVGFQRGDVLLLQSGNSRVDGMVIYRPISQLPNVRFQGNWIGRVLAEGPGELSWKASVLTLNGQQTSWQPQASGVPPQEKTIAIPAGSIAVLQPSESEVAARNRRGIFYGPPVTVLQLQDRVTVIPRDRIVGRVVWQTWPLSRWGMVE